MHLLVDSTDELANANWNWLTGNIYVKLCKKCCLLEYYA